MLDSPVWFIAIVQSLIASNVSPRLLEVNPLVVYVLNHGLKAPDPRNVSGA